MRLICAGGFRFARPPYACRLPAAIVEIQTETSPVTRYRSAAEQATRQADVQLTRIRKKAQVKRLVEKVIDSEANPSDAERPLVDLHERLDDPAIEAELGGRSIGAIVAGICRDLGITPDTPQWPDELVGMDEAPADRNDGATLTPALSRDAGAGVEPPPVLLVLPHSRTAACLAAERWRPGDRASVRDATRLDSGTRIGGRSRLALTLPSLTRRAPPSPAMRESGFQVWLRLSASRREGARIKSAGDGRRAR